MTKTFEKVWEEMMEMKVYRVPDYDTMSKLAANVLSAQIIAKPDSVLGLATGSTPIGTYQKLVKWYEMGELDFSKITSVNLDEYRGLSGDNDQSYKYFMHEHLFDKVNIDTANTYLPNGLAEDPKEECKRYEKLIKELGGVDIQLLGMGHNGHIGFNEPGTPFDMETHCVDLQEKTIEANQRFFASRDEVPKQAYTMGIQTIMNAKKILILVSGEDKAETLKKALCGPVTPDVPASILQNHEDVVLIADEAAMSKM